MKFTSLSTIINEWLILTDEDNFKEEDILTFAYRAIDRLPIDFQEIKVKLISVKDYKVALPNDFMQACQVACQVDESKCCDKKEVYGHVKRVLGKDCKMVCDCPLDNHESCDKCPSLDLWSSDVDSDPHYYYQKVKFLKDWHYIGHEDCCKSNICPKFELMEATSDCWHGLPCSMPCPNMKVKSKKKYRIDDSKYMTTSFSDGDVLLCYISRRTDKEGFPLVPDTTAVVDAIVASIEEKAMYKKYRSSLSLDETSRDYYNAYTVAKMNKNEALARARQELSIPDPDQFNTFVDNIWRNASI